ncbi:MAG: hypothetical protein PHD25_12320, partial [Bacteroidales bacterium]|nr:hypothetical protein [Bacteroidales bacterium]
MAAHLKTQDLKKHLLETGVCLPGKNLKRLKKVHGIGCVIRSFLYDGTQLIVVVTNKDDTNIENVICNTTLNPSDTVGLKMLPYMMEYGPIIQKMRDSLTKMFGNYIIVDDDDDDGDDDTNTSITPDGLLMDFLTHENNPNILQSLTGM